MFADIATITVKAGNGGNGLVSLSAKLPLKLITRFCLKMSKKGKVCLVKQIFDLQG